MEPSLPFQVVQHDSLRMGLPALKEEALPKHPVEEIQESSRAQTHITKLQMLRDVYGEALPLRMHIEEQILNRFHRLPGLPSSKLGLESLTGTLDEFSFESYLGLPEQSEVLPPDMHAQMEAQLGMGTKPQARGIF